MKNEKNNSAVEKVESVTVAGEKPFGGSAAVKSAKVNDDAKKAKKPVKRTKTVNSAKKTEENKAKNKAKATRNKTAKAKAEAKKLKEKKAEEKAQERLLKKQELERKRELLLAERLKKREERIARREALKNESREAKRERMSAERQERLRLKQERAELKARLISEKRENKRILKQEKMERSAQNKREKRERGIGGWLAAVITLGCSTLLLGTLLTFNWLYMSGANGELEASYQRAYYDLAGCVDNIDVNLGKLSVSRAPSLQQKLLTDIIVECELAEAELQSLPIRDESKYFTGKFINQLGDYSKTLSYKIADGGEISDEDREILNELYRRNGNLQQSLAKISAEMEEGYSLLSLLKPQEDDAVISNLNELENNSLEYPKMIYDGPFSDGLDTKEVKGLRGRELTKTEALEKFKILFADYAVKDACVVNDGEGEIPTYNVEAELESGSKIYAQMSKQGGRVVLFNCYEPCDVEKFTMDECREIAEVFLKKAGFEDMKPVWETSSNSVAQFNFAYEQNGVVVYPDLVKVNVCMERGIASSIEATGYLYNHTERALPKAKLGKEEAILKVADTLNVESARLVVVPVGGGKEALAYEIFALQDGQYFVYIDALTGKEIEIFKVVQTTEGTLLL